jgi:hypothetical protein
MVAVWRAGPVGQCEFDTNRDLQSPHGLLGQIEAVLGSELLGSQSWSKIRVR